MQHPSRRQVLGAATAALATPAVFRQAAAQSGPPFVVATFGGAFEDTLRRQVVPEFERQHGVKVALELGTGSTFIPKIIASPRRPPFDVVHLNDDEAILGDTLGLWAPDQSAKLPHASEVAAPLRADGLPMYTSVVYELPLIYRPEKMKAPTSWNDLWQPGITVGIPHISNSYGLTFLLIVALLNGGSAANMAPAFPALARLPRYKIFRGVTQGHAMFQQGEIDAGLFYNHRAQQLIDQGVPLAMASPKEGVWGQRTGVQIPKNASRMELSNAWADLTLSAPFQELFAKQLYSPTNTRVSLPPELAAKLVVGEQRMAALKYPDWRVINPQRDDLLTQWSRTFGG